MSSCFTVSDKIEGLKQKLKRWKVRVSKNCYDMFPNLSNIIEEGGEETDIVAIRNIVSAHLTNLAERFDTYFPEDENPGKSNKWIRNPFVTWDCQKDSTL